MVSKLRRCFISIELPEEIKNKIRKIQNGLPEFKGKLVESENLHLTLKFLGEIDEDKIEIVKKKLSGMKFKKLNCNLDSIGVFSESFVRIVWVYLSGCEELQKKIDDALKGIFAEEKQFMSHITIARVKSVKDKKRFLEELKKIKIEEINFNTDKFYLMESVLKPEGPEYNIIECFGEEKYD